MQLPISALPHVITPSLALSVASDLLPRLSHTNPNVRKKTIVTLYRLALVYPETLRAAWPKIKERLMDKEENSSVTAAIVNVVCELSWRRPNDFLPLAPRLFELLVDTENNWMAIKLIKLVRVACLLLLLASLTFWYPSWRLTFVVLVVCDLDATRASSSSQALASFNQIDPIDACHVSALRVH